MHFPKYIFLPKLKKYIYDKTTKPISLPKPQKLIFPVKPHNIFFRPKYVFPAKNHKHTFFRQNQKTYFPVKIAKYITPRNRLNAVFRQNRKNAFPAKTVKSHFSSKSQNSFSRQNHKLCFFFRGSLLNKEFEKYLKVLDPVGFKDFDGDFDG